MYYYGTYYVPEDAHVPTAGDAATNASPQGFVANECGDNGALWHDPSHRKIVEPVAEPIAEPNGEGMGRFSRHAPDC